MINLRRAAILIFFLLLSGCSHVRVQDGPPHFYVDESRVPNATPKIEPKSHYGNLPIYRVKGKHYRVLRTSKHYQATGIASWYGTRFHARRTSSGERYNMLAMTAAHKTLPLPTYVRVLNLNNHRQIIVKVNDRGPFKPGRIIDLSYVAAKKLGMMARGTARVRVTAIDPKEYLASLHHTPARHLKVHRHLAHSTAKKYSPPMIRMASEHDWNRAKRI